MIIVKLKGGLGNQMFQYALARHVALLRSTELKLDVSALGAGTAAGDAVRHFSLAQFSITAPVASDAEIALVKPTDRTFTKLVGKLRNRLLGDPTVRFHPSYLKAADSSYLEGYWQSPRYFEAIRETLLSEFTLREPLSPYGQEIAVQMQSSLSVSLHVRRGDYASNPRVLREAGLCAPAYYREAMKHIAGRAENVRYFVFSDDIAWVRANLPVGNNAVYVSNGELTDAQELWLMSRASHNIIANSSFSWWGAWLNQNPAKLVVAPTPWFDRAAYDANLIPDSWKQIKKYQ
jgi:hypothetical protein